MGVIAVCVQGDRSEDRTPLLELLEELSDKSVLISDLLDQLVPLPVSPREHSFERVAG